jgi:uncharacterized membrane protein
MNILNFTIGVLVLLFGYNFAIIKWQKYQERKRQERIGYRTRRRY